MDLNLSTLPFSRQLILKGCTDPQSLRIEKALFSKQHKPNSFFTTGKDNSVRCIYCNALLPCDQLLKPCRRPLTQLLSSGIYLWYSRSASIKSAKSTRASAAKAAVHNSLSSYRAATQKTPVLLYTLRTLVGRYSKFQKQGLCQRFVKQAIYRFSGTPDFYLPGEHLITPLKPILFLAFGACPFGYHFLRFRNL